MPHLSPHTRYNASPSQQAVRDMVQAFAAKEITHRINELDRSGDPPKFPRDLYKKLGEAGFIGFVFPKEYGGQAKSRLEYITLIEELCYHDPSVGLMCTVGELAANCILLFGTDAQKKKYLPDCLNGKKVFAFSLTEPQAGSDASAITTTAVETDNGYVINGEKTFIMHGDVADTVVLFCKVEGKQKISAFIVETNQPGWNAWGLKYKMGMRAATTGAATLTNVLVPKEDLLGEIDKGLRYALTALDVARIGTGAQGVGIAQRALDESIAYANKRIAFGNPIAKFEAIQWMIADMSTRLEAARLLTYKAAQVADNNESVALAASQAKLFSSEAANFCVDKAMQIHAGYGYIGEFSIIEKLYRDQRVIEIYEGTSEVQRMVIASHLLGNK